MDWGDLLSVLLGALVTAVLGFAGILQKRHHMERDKRREEQAHAAEFLSAVADALAGMVTHLGQGLIPREKGHSFERLLKDYDDRLGRHLSSDARDDVEKLRDVSRRAREMDDDLYRALQEDFEPDKAKSSTLLNEMERLVGDLRGEAKRIETRPLGR